MEATHALLSTFLVLGAAAINTQISPTNEIVAWGKPVDGLKVGMSCDTQATDAAKLPKLFFFVVNGGDRDIQSDAKCIVAINRRYYAQEFEEGKSSWMPPGRQYGPIAIDVERLRQVAELQKWRIIDQSSPSPKLLKDTNSISLYYVLGNKLVESGEIKVVFR